MITIYVQAISSTLSAKFIATLHDSHPSHDGVSCTSLSISTNSKVKVTHLAKTTFLECGHNAYQIKGNEAYDNIQAHNLTLRTALT